MKTFEIWQEGYRATGESGTAYKRGEVEAESFQKACDKLLIEDSYYNSRRLTYWGCKLFDNETDARKGFG